MHSCSLFLLLLRQYHIHTVNAWKKVPAPFDIDTNVRNEHDDTILLAKLSLKDLIAELWQI